MTEYEKLRTRIVLAHSVNRSPDSVTIVESTGEDVATLYLLDDFEGVNLAFCFKDVPTTEEAREEVKNGYLSFCELRFDTEFNEKNKKSI